MFNIYKSLIGYFDRLRAHQSLLWTCKNAVSMFCGRLSYRGDIINWKPTRGVSMVGLEGKVWRCLGENPCAPLCIPFHTYTPEIIILTPTLAWCICTWVYSHLENISLKESINTSFSISTKLHVSVCVFVSVSVCVCVCVCVHARMRMLVCTLQVLHVCMCLCVYSQHVLNHYNSNTHTHTYTLLCM